MIDLYGTAQISHAFLPALPAHPDHGHEVQYYQETTLEPFSSWTNALSYIDGRQQEKQLVLVIDEFPYLVRKNRALLSELQHLIDHRLKNGNMFIVLCGSYMGSMEKEVLGFKSPLFGRRTG